MNLYQRRRVKHTINLSKRRKRKRTRMKVKLNKKKGQYSQLKTLLCNNKQMNHEDMSLRLKISPQIPKEDYINMRGNIGKLKRENKAKAK